MLVVPMIKALNMIFQFFFLFFFAVEVVLVVEVNCIFF
jgi:hypothetical protein